MDDQPKIVIEQSTNTMPFICIYIATDCQQPMQTLISHNRDWSNGSCTREWIREKKWFNTRKIYESWFAMNQFRFSQSQSKIIIKIEDNYENKTFIRWWWWWELFPLSLQFGTSICAKTIWSNIDSEIILKMCNKYISQSKVHITHVDRNPFGHLGLINLITCRLTSLSPSLCFHGVKPWG